jgi:hypothetical protein
MTLDTRVYVLDRISAKDVWLKCNQLIGADESVKAVHEQKKSWRKGESFVEPGDPWWYWNRPGQGLCALLDVQYRPDAPLRSEADAAAHDEDCNLPGTEWYDEEAGPCDGSWHYPACWLEISFDTAYSYKDEQGRGCGDLHASLLADLGRWLDERGVRWAWKNEFTGEVHTGYEQLIELCTGGFEASAWFRTTVAPAIQREIGGAL